MYDDLRTVLSGEVSPERTELLLYSAELLDSVDFYGHHLELQELIYNYENLEVGSLSLAVEDILKTGLLFVLNNFSVFTQTENLPLINAMVHGIGLITNYDDTDGILAICESESDPEIKFSDLMELVTDYTSDEFLMELSRVSVRFIERLTKLVSDRVERTEEVESREPVIAPIRTRLKNYLEDKTFIVTEAIVDGLPLGQCPEVLMDLFAGELEELKPSRAAEELVAILLASELPTEDIEVKAGEYLENLYSEPSQVSEAVMALTEVIKGLGQHG